MKKKQGRPMKIDGIDVVNATKPLEVHITQADITGSDRKSPSSCAAARAAIRQIASCRQARVHATRVYLLMVDGKNRKKWVRHSTPRGLHIETVAFDRGGDMQPDDYMLMPPSERRSYGQRQGSAAPGARDRGSRDRTPSFKRKHVLANVRLPARER